MGVPVSVKKNTPPDQKTLGSIGLKSTTSGPGEEFLLLDCRARARVKGVFFADTGMGTLHARTPASAAAGTSSLPCDKRWGSQGYLSLSLCMMHIYIYTHVCIYIYIYIYMYTYKISLSLYISLSIYIYIYKTYLNIQLYVYTMLLYNTFPAPAQPFRRPDQQRRPLCVLYCLSKWYTSCLSFPLKAHSTPPRALLSNRRMIIDKGP